MVEQIVHIDGVTGSSPVATTLEPKQKLRLISYVIEQGGSMKCMKCEKAAYTSVTSEAIELGFGLLVIHDKISTGGVSQETCPRDSKGMILYGKDMEF